MKLQLSFRPLLGKRELLKQAGVTETARIDLHNYIKFYGHDLEIMSEQIRRFFVAGQVHYRRSDYMRGVGECLKIDLRQPKGRDTLWETVVEALNPRRAYGDQWRVGQADMPLVLNQA